MLCYIPATTLSKLQVNNLILHHVWQDVAGELEKKYKIKTVVIAVDFTEPELVYNNISEGIKVNLLFKFFKS